MPGKHPKGTNDADGNGEKGGSLPEDQPEVEAASEAEGDEAAEAPEPKAKAKKLSDAERLDRLEKLAAANGWSGL